MTATELAEAAATICAALAYALEEGEVTRGGASLALRMLAATLRGDDGE